jgi:C4-dicarboxylate transporter
MAFNIDDWIPNFNLFVYFLAPVIIAIVAAMIISSKWLNRERGRKKKMKLVEILSYIPAVYALWPIYEIGEYLIGRRDEIFDRLFTYHYPILMFFILLVGIAQISIYGFNIRSTGGST